MVYKHIIMIIMTQEALFVSLTFIEFRHFLHFLFFRKIFFVKWHGGSLILSFPSINSYLLLIYYCMMHNKNLFSVVKNIVTFIVSEFPFITFVSQDEMSIANLILQLFAIVNKLQEKKINSITQVYERMLFLITYN